MWRRSLSRRTFLRAGLSLPAWSAAPGAAGSHSLNAGRAQATLTSTGGLADLRFDGVALVDANLGADCPRFAVGGKIISCDRPISARRTPLGVLFEYGLESEPPLRVEYEVELRPLPDESACLVQRIAFRSDRSYSDSIGLELPRNVRLPAGRRSLLSPSREGIARRMAVPESAAPRFVYTMAGGGPDAAGHERGAHETEAGRRAVSKADPHKLDAFGLAMPLLDEYAERDALRITACGEPGFTTVFRPATDHEAGSFGWTHTAGGRPGEVVARTFHTVLHRGPDRRAFHSLYGTSLAEVRPGPQWLHEVTLVHYDYLSKNGAGWFADIEALARVIPRADRGKVVLTIHGWYDFVGRYAFDPKTQSLDRKWLAFPNAADPRFLAHAAGPKSKTETFWGWRKILDGLRPVEMSIEDLHRRIRHAKERGFRCLLYFADGLNSGDGLSGIHEPNKILAQGGWIGPETSGSTYSQNPLHPAVRSFFRDYLGSLLDEFGRELDGFVWDETFHVRAGQQGSAAYPGYADAAMMSLVAELRAMTERHNPGLAFLTSDIVGPTYLAPYALVSHGTFQDSMCGMRYWPYGLFPNLRNTLWSCNWYHQTTWQRNEDSVAAYEVPIAISNGFGDNTGPSDMNAEQIGKMMALFAKLGDRQLELGWMDETSRSPSYRRRESPLR